MPIMFSIRKTPASHDSDDLIMEGMFKGFGYVSKKDGKIGLIRCPKCGRENYAMSVASGQCSWCGWQANKYFSKVEDIIKKKDNV